MLIGSHAGGLTGCLLYEQGFVKQILDVADNLERAAGAVPGTALENGEAVEHSRTSEAAPHAVGGRPDDAAGVDSGQRLRADPSPVAADDLYCCTVSCTMCSAF